MAKETPDRRSSTELQLTKLTVAFEYLQSDVKEIKDNVKDIKNDSITRREHEEKTKSLQDQISTLRNQVYGVAGTVIAAVIYSILNLVLKK